MKTFFLNCKLCVTFWNIITSILGKLLCFIKKPKKSREESNFNQSNMPLSIQIQGDQKTTEIDLVDWNNWGEEEAKQPDNEEEEKEIPAEELFKDMEPTINKAKVVHVTRKIRATSGSPTKTNASPFAFQSNYGNSHSKNSRYTPKYQVETELGTMDDDDDACGWDNDVNDLDIDKETDNMIKLNKQRERQKRAEEQRRKKLEKEQLRLARKQEGHIGVKIS